MNHFFHRTGVQVIIGIIALGGIGYGVYQYRHTTIRLTNTVQTLEQTKNSFQTTIDELVNRVVDLETKQKIIIDSLTSTQQDAGSIALRLSQIDSTVGTLSKLSETDPELLKKYSKVYFLNEHYVPLSLTNIDPIYSNEKSRTYQIHSSVAPHLTALLAAAKADGLNLLIGSAYRSFGTQAALKTQYKVTYGAGTANAFSADQGYSEHQLGTTVDFTTSTSNGALSGFENKPEYPWLQANAHKYGFVLSYPPNNIYYKFEPWHWRYVGVALATKLHNDNMYFYDMDQRIIDDYLAQIFD